jgi:hypothetical protein
MGTTTSKRTSARLVRRQVRCRLEVAQLEQRALLSGITATIHANPNILWPPNHKLVPVTVSGRVFDTTSPPAGSIHFSVVDEYGQVDPHGTVRLGPHDTYSFVVMLPASRTGQDKDGRTFTIFVTASDGAGNTTTVDTVVLVPHDMGHPFNFTGSNSSTGGNGNGGGNGHGHGNGNDNGNDNGNGHGHG